MTTAVQRRRGTTTEHASFTGLEGEISVNTTKETLVVHDGSTAGGFELARADGSNFIASSVDINGGTIDGTTIGASVASTGAFTSLSASGEIVATGGIKITETAGGNFLKFDVDGTADEATVGMDSTDLIISVDPTNARANSDFIIKNDGTETFRIAANGAATFAGGITATAPMIITIADNNTQLTLESTDEDATVGPRFDLHRNSASPAASDNLGQIRFLGDDSAGALTSYAFINSFISNPTDGAESGEIVIETRIGGANRQRFTATPTETIINEDGADLDFRVESDGGTHALFVEGSSGSVGIGTSSPATAFSVVGAITTTDGVYLGGTAAANLLDYYEEGTWTPVFSDAAGGGNDATAGTSEGHYIRVGNVVTATVSMLNISPTGLTAANTLYIKSASLPFAAVSYATADHWTAIVNGTNTFAVAQPVMVKHQNGSGPRFGTLTSNTSSYLDVDEVLDSGGGTDMRFSWTYFTS